MKWFTFLCSLVFVLTGFFLVKTYQPSIRSMYPEECSFLMDEQFSDSFQQELRSYVIDRYKESRDPQVVLDAMSSSYPEVVAADAYICKTDKLCFTLDGPQPLFMLNHDQVICNNQQTINKARYRKDIIQDLYSISAQSEQDLSQVTQLFQHMPHTIFADFDVHWNNASEIALQAKGKKSETLLFSAQMVPTQADIELFKKIQQEMKPKGKKKNKIYDFRFKNQVVLK